MYRPPNQRRGFSLIELLVVIGIIAVLIAILLPVLSHVRKSARSSACLANLRQWGMSFQMYINANKGSMMPFASERYTGTYWWEYLEPYNSNIRGTLICPAASAPKSNFADPGDGVRRTNELGSASNSWHWHTYKIADPAWILRGDWHGSYTFNHSLYTMHSSWGNFRILLPAPGSERIPLVGDGCFFVVDATDFIPPRVPRNLQQPEEIGGLDTCCIDRHQMAVNFVFLDGHAQRVPLPELWQLKWNNMFSPQQVQVPRP